MYVHPLPSQSVYSPLCPACRTMSTAVAQWLEDQGGFPLFTIEGEEPEVAKISWHLPLSSLQRKGAADAAEQLNEQSKDNQRQSGVFGLSSPASR